MGASSGSADSLAKLVRRIFSDAIDLASNPNEVYEPSFYKYKNALFITADSKYYKRLFIHTASDAAMQ